MNVFDQPLETWSDAARSQSAILCARMLEPGDARVMDSDDYANMALFQFVQAYSRGGIIVSPTQYLTEIIRNLILSDLRRKRRAALMDPTHLQDRRICTALGIRVVDEVDAAHALVTKLLRRLRGTQQMSLAYFWSNRVDFANTLSNTDFEGAADVTGRSPVAIKKALQRVRNVLSESPLVPDPREPRVDTGKPLPFTGSTSYQAVVHSALLQLEFSRTRVQQFRCESDEGLKYLIGPRADRRMRPPRDTMDYVTEMYSCLAYFVDASEFLFAQRCPGSSLQRVILQADYFLWKCIATSRLFRFNAITAVALEQWLRLLLATNHYFNRGQLPDFAPPSLHRGIFLRRLDELATILSWHSDGDAVFRTVRSSVADLEKLPLADFLEPKSLPEPGLPAPDRIPTAFCEGIDVAQKNLQEGSIP